MDTVKDFFESLYDNYRDRVKSPFIGSLILSYLAYNWRTIAILLFSEWPMHYRIDWIEQMYCNWHNYLVPFLMSIFYIFGLPHINLGIEWLLKGYTKKRQAKIDALETARLNKRKENAKILREIAEEKAGTSEIINLKERIESLQHENSNLTIQNQDDLERHNKAMKQSKIIEDGFKHSMRIYAVQNSLLFKSSVEGKENINFHNTQQLIEIADNFSESEKKFYEEFYIKLRESNEIVNTDKLLEYDKLGLLKTLTRGTSKTAYFTAMGNLLYEYFKNGFDLL